MVATWDVISRLTCENGHPYTPETVAYVSGRWRCRPCHADSVRISAQRKKAARPPLPCAGCGAMVDQAERKRKYCTPACGHKASARRRYHAMPEDERVAKGGYAHAPKSEVPCESCGASVLKRGNESRRFCDDCGTGKGHVARAKRYGVAIGPINRNAVFARNGWICQICNGAVDKSLSWPHAESASLDHIVPLSRGGGHVESNVQLAHLGCNIRKGADVTSSADHPDCGPARSADAPH